METIEFSSKRLKERYTQIRHDSGLSVYVFPKQLTGIYALLATDLGSLDTVYRPAKGAEPVTLPSGIAHFLEHKLFENEDGSDSLARFSEWGADANAYTSYNKTAYLFSCTDHFEESLEELLHFVFSPHFTEASVKKEIGIISEEIRMTEDDPWDRGFQRMLEAMYQNHPVREPICGTQKSIRRITPKLLYDCYRAFYDPSRMVLVVCGDVTEETVLAVVDRMLAGREGISQTQRVRFDEPETVARTRVEARMQVAKPIFFMGFKDLEPPEDVRLRLRRDAAMTLLNETLFSRSGAFYNELFESGVLTPSFSCGYSIAEGFAFNCISGEADDPDAVCERILSYLEQVKREGIPDGELERARRVLYADEVRAYDSTEEIANRLLSFALEGGEMFAYPELLSQIQKEELIPLLDALCMKAHHSISVIYPLE